MFRAPARRSLAMIVGFVPLVGCGNFQTMRPAPFTARPAEETASAQDGALRAYFVGHATVLLRIADKWIITDPNFSSRVGVIAKRYVAPGIDLDELPHIDWILVSHAHSDHLDHASLERLNASASIAVPPGVVPHLPGRPFARVAALDPWQSVESDGVRITAVPVRHRDDRFFFDGIWARKAHTGFLVEYAGETVFFAGDTAYDAKMFRALGQHYRIDLALIPVGPAGEGPLARIFTKPVHANPEEGMKIFEDVHARYMIPIHYGTFWNASNAEVSELMRAIHDHHADNRVFILRAGQSATL